MAEVQEIISDQLSHFRTSHRFLHYAEFTALEEYLELWQWARRRRLKLFILGNGSNTLFARPTVRTLVLRNRLGKWMNVLDERRVEVSSAAPITVVLKHCQQHSLDSCYYLASVPATVGGAVAMNAGRGRKHGQTIFDYLESVRFVRDGEVHTWSAEQIPRDYRWTMFTGCTDMLIVSAVLRFEPRELDGDELAARAQFSRDEQDLSAPNCGSVFKQHSGSLMRRLRGLRFGGAAYSPKTTNWILNRAKSPRGIVGLIRIARGLHWALGRRAKLELIRVD